MFRVAHGIAYFGAEATQRILEISRTFNSAKRTAYQLIHKHQVIDKHELYHKVKERYGDRLTGLYIQPAVALALRLNEKPEVIFGGQKAWEDLVSGALDKAEWQLKRNGSLYCSGNKLAPNGNDLIRVQGDRLVVCDPAARCKRIVGKLWLPKKWATKVQELEKYDARITYDSSKQSFHVQLSYDDKVVQVKPDFSRGCIGLDCNPDGIAVVEVDGEGSMIKHLYEQNTRMRDAREGKRDHDVRELAKRIVQYVQESDKPLVLEKLSFKNQRSSWKKFNRMRHNFVYRKLIKAITSRASRLGIGVTEVNPAFTSQLGLLKYAKMYSLNRHTAAALVIARRGMGILERRDFEVKQNEKKNEKLNLEGRGFSIASTQKAWSWLRDKFLKPNAVVLTGPELAAGLRPVIGSSNGGIPLDEALTTDKSLAGRVIDLATRELELLSSRVV